MDESEEIPLVELSQRLPMRPSYKTLYRFARNGVRSESGMIVKLETVRLTNGRGSSVKRYREFQERVKQ